MITPIGKRIFRLHLLSIFIAKPDCYLLIEFLFYFTCLIDEENSFCELSMLEPQ
jgi:hypothetical protein